MIKFSFDGNKDSLEVVSEYSLTNLSGAYLGIQEPVDFDSELKNAGENQEALTAVAKLQYSLATLGYKLSEDFIKFMYLNYVDNVDKYNALATILLDSLYKLTGNRGFKSLYLNFPEDVLKATPEERFILAISHYIFGTAGYLMEGSQAKEAETFEKSDIVKAKELKLLTTADLINEFVKLMHTNTALSDMQTKFVESVFNLVDTEEDIYALNNLLYASKDKMVFKELKTLFIYRLLGYKGNKVPNKILYRSMAKSLFSNPTDILRYLLLLVTSDTQNKIEVPFGKEAYFELNRKHMYLPKHLSNYEQKMISDVLQDMVDLKGMQFVFNYVWQYRNVWKSYFKMYGKSVRSKNHKDVIALEDAVLYGNKADLITTKGIRQSIYLRLLGRLHGEYSGRFDEEFENVYKTILKRSIDEHKVSDMELLVELLDTYEDEYGTLVRDVVKILGVVSTKGNNYDELINTFLMALNAIPEGTVNNRVYLQAIARLDSLLLKKKLSISSAENEMIKPLRDTRIVNVKGVTTILDEAWKDIPMDAIVRANDVLNSQYSKATQGNIVKDAEGNEIKKVFLDESYKNVAITTSQRGASNALSPMTKGSRIPVAKDADIYRIFIGWKNMDDNNNSNYGRIVDIDLSATTLDKYGKTIGRLYYGNAYSSGNNNSALTFSGDITNAPKGAMEYIDINIDKYLERNENVRYIVMHINSFSHQPFDVIGNVRAGVMSLTAEEAKDNMYKPSAVDTAFSVVSDNTNTMPLIFDLVNREFIWVDSNIGNGRRIGPNNIITHSEDNNSVMAHFLMETPKSMYELIEAHDVELVEDKEDADVVFDKISFENPLPLSTIQADWM